MEEILFVNNILTFRGYNYSIGFIEAGTGDNVYVNLVNPPYTFTILLIANEIIINGVLQTSADMIIDTLSNGQS